MSTLKEEEVAFASADGWRIAGSFHVPDGPGPHPAALLVPASRHERDGYGPTLLAELARRGVVVLRIDVRGRGGSRDPVAMYELPPGQRRRLAGDVAGALALLAERPEVDADRLVVVAEQDLADAAVRAGTDRGGILAWVLLSPRLAHDTPELLAASGAPLLLMTSREDRRGLDDGVRAVGRHPASSVRVLDGLGFGTTMFAAWQFLHRGEETLEAKIATWVGEVVAGSRT